MVYICIYIYLYMYIDLYSMFSCSSFYNSCGVFFAFSLVLLTYADKSTLKLVCMTLNGSSVY